MGMGQVHNRGSVRAAIVMIVGGLLLAVLTVGNVDRALAQTLELKCDVGTLIDGQCVEEGAPPTQSGPPECPALPELYPVDGNCYMLVEGGEKLCPAGTTPDPDGLSCRQPVPKVPTEIPPTPTCPIGTITLTRACLVETAALQVAPECLPDALGTAGSCYRLSTSNRVCDFGVLVGDVCVIDGDPPRNGPSSCPVGPNVFEDGAFCYTPVDLVNGACPPPLVADPSGTSCRQQVPHQPGSSMCAPGFGLVDGRCIRYGAPSFTPFCDNNAPLDDFGYCREPVADRVDELFCLPGGEIVNDECVFTLPRVDCDYSTAIVGQCTFPDGYCPTGFLANPQGSTADCERTELASQGEPTCPFGARGVANGCYILVAKGPSEFVDQCPPAAERVGDVCVLESEPIVIDGEPVCFADLALVDGVCLSTFPPSSSAPACPPGSVEDFNNECRRPVANAQGAFFCESRFGSLIGRTCFIVADIQTPCGDVTDCEPSACPAGYEDAGDRCERVEPALIAAVECPIGGAGTAGSCYRYVRPQIPSPWSCPVGQAGPHALCELEGSSAPPGCGEPFVFDGGRCVRFTVPYSPSGPPTCSPFFPEDESGRCRIGTGDAVGPYYCEDPSAALGFRTCTSLVSVFTQTCPEAYSPDDSLGGICTRFEPAIEGPPSCPLGARGEPGDCYILVARGPRGPGICDEGMLSGSVCVIIGDPPAPGPSTCPVSATVRLENGVCFELVEADGEPCEAPRMPDPGETDFCRELVPERPGAAMCTGPFGIVNGECVLFDAPSFPAPRCPDNSTEDDDGNCRQMVPNAPAGLICSDPDAALNGRSCVTTAGFVFQCNGDVAICGEPTIELVCQELLDGMDCYRLISSELTCPEPGTPHVASMTCRKPVEMVTPVDCPDGSFEQVDTRCLRFSAPTSMIETMQGAGEDADDQELLTLAATDIVYAGCPGGSGSYSVSGSEGTVTGDLVESPAGVYTGTYEVDAAGTYDVSLVVSCPDGTVDEAVDQVVFIDPSGVVLDCSGDPVIGAQVTLLRSATIGGQLVAVADGDASVMDPSVNVRNPTTVDATGRYRWDVTAGFYQVEASVAGQPSVRSEVLEVPPARTDVDLVFSDLNCTTPEPTPEPTSVVRPAAPVLASPNIELGPDSNAAAAVTQPAPDSALASAPLAVTGTEAGRGAMLGLSLLAAGTVLVGAGWARRRRLT